MALAIHEARAAGEAGDVPVGAVLVCDGRVVGRGRNTREALHDPTGHAELNALRMGAATLGRWRLHRCVLYVTLEPCAMCAAALVQARLPVLVYGANDPKAGAAGSRLNLVEDARLNHRVEVIAGLAEAACSELLTQFFRGDRLASTRELQAHHCEGAQDDHELDHGTGPRKGSGGCLRDDVPRRHRSPLGPNCKDL
ncbi:MAG: tRNA adenosine(34) deaminase TadA [Candidatus Sericytochromatia bacterium]|nr:tRNA adenosine(34) deaminase TadA [Candidatus Sericytochromatia bacterium]